MAGQQECHAPNLQDLRSPLSDLSNEVLFVFVLFLVLSKIDEIRNQYLRCTIASARICMKVILQCIRRQESLHFFCNAYEFKDERIDNLSRPEFQCVESVYDTHVLLSISQFSILVPYYLPLPCKPKPCQDHRTFHSYLEPYLR